MIECVDLLPLPGVPNRYAVLDHRGFVVGFIDVRNNDTVGIDPGVNGFDCARLNAIAAWAGLRYVAADQWGRVAS